MSTCHGKPGSVPPSGARDGPGRARLARGRVAAGARRRRRRPVVTVGRSGRAHRARARRVGRRAVRGRARGRAGRRRRPRAARGAERASLARASARALGGSRAARPRARRRGRRRDRRSAERQAPRAYRGARKRDRDGLGTRPDWRRRLRPPARRSSTPTNERPSHGVRAAYRQTPISYSFQRVGVHVLPDGQSDGASQT